MLEQVFNEVYTKFKLHFYRAVFGRFQKREASLTTVETFCMEIIMALGRPTVNEFSSFVGISPPNAAYKINNLVQKGYVRKEQSEEDKREYHLVVTQKYIDYYNISYSYLGTVMARIRAVPRGGCQKDRGDAGYHLRGTDAGDPSAQAVSTDVRKDPPRIFVRSGPFL